MTSDRTIRFVGQTWKSVGTTALKRSSVIPLRTLAIIGAVYGSDIAGD